jgi:acyl-CoA reductase-like NAD-dependent aldehyde dehydrogenase
MKKKRKGMKWYFGVYDPYTDTQIAKVKNLNEDQFDIAVKEFRKKF